MSKAQSGTKAQPNKIRKRSRNCVCGEVPIVACLRIHQQREKRIDTERGEREMGFMLRVRLSSFFAGATVASVAGAFFLYKDYKQAQESLYSQVISISPPLRSRSYFHCFSVFISCFQFEDRKSARMREVLPFFCSFLLLYPPFYFFFFPKISNNCSICISYCV